MNHLEPLLALLAERGHDFRDYRQDMLARRIGERMTAIGEPDAAAYTARVAADPAEAAALAEMMLVTTSRFFRDPEVFDALERIVLPRLVQPPKLLRAWIAGTAGGEEAWSLAMLLDGTGPHEIIASDASARAVERARTARYPRSAIAHVPARFHHHLAADAGDVTIAGAMRARVRFAHHDLFGPALAPREAVLARFDLVLCRNVLIYLDPRLQDRLFERLAGVLAPGGVLGIGPYERLTAAAARVLEPVPGVEPALNFLRARST
jgi:chemotaxis methyl-accepting protein methylase